MAMMLVVYPMPDDLEAFDRHYVDIHGLLTKKLPGLRKCEVSDGPVATPCSVYGSCARE